MAQQAFPLITQLSTPEVPAAVRASIILLWQQLAAVSSGTPGPPGPPGPAGATGPTGPAGSDASVHAAVDAGNVAGDFAVSGITVGNFLVLILRVTGAGLAVTDVVDLTSEFTITAPNTINNAGGTDTTGSKLVILWSVT